MGQAELEAFVRQFLRLVPLARQPGVETEMIQGRDQRSDTAAPPAFADHSPQRFPATWLPVGEWAVELIVRMRRWSVSLRRPAMAASTGENAGRGTDRVARSDRADTGPWAHPARTRS